MAIFEPVYKGEPVFGGGIGKDSPYGKATGLYRPNIVGPGSGRIKAVIKGAEYVGRYFRKNPRFGARIIAVGGGALVANRYRNAPGSKYRKTLYSTKSFQRGFRRNKQSLNRSCCCCTKSHNRRQRRR